MRILIADDNSVTRRMLKSFLAKWGYEVVTTKDGDEAWEVLKENDCPDIAILDWVMPGKEGIEVCRMVRAANKPSYIYIIILTSLGNQEDIIAGLQAGADDYVIKPFSYDEFRCRVCIGERIINLEREIMIMAATDGLTGLWNRREFMGKMDTEFKRSRKEGHPLGVILSDIDFFKKVNDTFGHQAGDLVLQECAGCLRYGIREPYFVGRYGGEEFIAGCPGLTLDSVASLAEDIRNELKSLWIPAPDGSSHIPVTASFGVSVFLPGESNDKTIDTIIKRADDALYRAKAEGRDRVCKQI
ncbi:MAG: diguanylate cyclase [Deltaproteobacteria bacterium]|nr:diguanylate cyclase [Deltaproteobacteria bacterium]